MTLKALVRVFVVCVCVPLLCAGGDLRCVLRGLVFVLGACCAIFLSQAPGLLVLCLRRIARERTGLVWWIWYVNAFEG